MVIVVRMLLSLSGRGDCRHGAVGYHVVGNDALLNLMLLVMMLLNLMLLVMMLLNLMCQVNVLLDIMLLVMVLQDIMLLVVILLDIMLLVRCCYISWCWS